MRVESKPGNGRHKSRSRRMAREWRLWLPFIGLLCCYSLSATAIVVTELATLESRPEQETHFLTISSSSTSKTSAAFDLMRGGMPRLP